MPLVQILNECECDRCVDGRNGVFHNNMWTCHMTGQTFKLLHTEEVDPVLNHPDKIGCTCGAVWSWDGEHAVGPCRGNHEKNPGIVDDMKVRALQRNCPCCWVD